MDEDLTRKHFESLIGKLSPKVEVKNSFKRKKSDIENLCSAKESGVWVHRTDEEKIELVDIEGKWRREINLGFVPNEVIKLSSDRWLLSCPDECRIYSLSEDGITNEFTNCNPCKPLGMTVTQDGHIMFCVVEDWTFDITSSSKRCIRVLDTTDIQSKEIEFDNRGKRMFTFPHTITQNKDGT